jgi:hypothetical protein
MILSLIAGRHLVEMPRSVEKCSFLFLLHPVRMHPDGMQANRRIFYFYRAMQS